MELVIAVACHAFRARQDHKLRLHGHQQESIEQDKVRQVPHLEDDR